MFFTLRASSCSAVGVRWLMARSKSLTYTGIYLRINSSNHLRKSVCGG